MKRFFGTLVFLVVVLPLMAQNHHHPRRTAADIARKQTEMLVRELHITDSALRDTLFRMHLKYAEMRNDSTYTRADAIQCMILIQEELKQILSPEQFEAFMNRQLNHEPRAPQNPCNWIAPHPHHGERAPLPQEAPDMPPLPLEHQP